MKSLRKRLLELAQRKYGKVTPPQGLPWEDCYTEHEGKLLLWFNKETGTTSVISTSLKNNR
jgi:hypothetical protein